MCSEPEDPDPGARGARDERLAHAGRHHRALRPLPRPHLPRVRQRHDQLLRKRGPPVAPAHRRLCRARRRDPAEPRVLHPPAQRGARAHPLRQPTRAPASRAGFRWGNPFYANGPAGQGSGSQSQWNWGKKNGDESQGAVRPQEAQAVQGQPARAHAERRPAQGQRQARQPGGHRRRGGVARGGHGAGRVRRRRLRELRGHAERDGGAAPRERLPLRHRRDVRRHPGRDHAARQRGRGLRGAARGARRAARAGRRRGRAGAPEPPRLLAGDRPGDAPPPAGGGRHRRAPQDRHRRGEHGRDGARTTSASTRPSSSTRSARRPW